jgi:four helix bundle protein
MPNEENKDRSHDLEERTLKFAKATINLCKKLARDVINVKLIGQLIRASGSVGANYREANEALSKKDFLHRMKITRKECKESSYWLELLREANPQTTSEIDILFIESKELRNIFTSIINKSK